VLFPSGGKYRHTATIGSYLELTTQSTGNKK